jgi:hypothetical protein
MNQFWKLIDNLNTAGDRNPIPLNVHPESVLWNFSGMGHVSFGHLNALTIKQKIPFQLE